MASVGHANTLTCKNASTGGFSAADNNTDAPDIAVGLVDSDSVTYPDVKPTVRKAVAADDNIYGKFVHYEVATNEVTIARGGIQSFVKSAASVAADIGMGIIGVATAGQVDTADNKGSGVVIGRNGTTVWVDLDAGSRGTT